MRMNPTLSITKEETDAAHAEWGCNCGPSALAAALDLKLDQVRPHLLDFEQRGYMSAAMMRGALARLGFSARPVRDGRYYDGLALVQWSGPWLKPGVHWAERLRRTHWVAMRQHDHWQWVFDVNNDDFGWVPLHYWTMVTAPRIIREAVKGGDGKWEWTHSWQTVKLRR